jgi:hypothetical protein
VLSGTDTFHYWIYWFCHQDHVGFHVNTSNAMPSEGCICDDGNPASMIPMHEHLTLFQLHLHISPFYHRRVTFQTIPLHSNIQFSYHSSPNSHLIINISIPLQKFQLIFFVLPPLRPLSLQNGHFHRRRRLFPWSSRLHRVLFHVAGHGTVQAWGCCESACMFYPRNLHVLNIQSMIRRGRLISPDRKGRPTGRSIGV